MPERIRYAARAGRLGNGTMIRPHSPLALENRMQAQRARQILQALIQGVDPFNGEELSHTTVLQQADVLRAMLAGVAALEQGAARAARRAQLPGNVGRPWTAEEELALIKEMEAQTALQDIAAKHARTLRAIEIRLEKVGLLSAAQRITRNRFGDAQ